MTSRAVVLVAGGIGVARVAAIFSIAAVFALVPLAIRSGHAVAATPQSQASARPAFEVASVRENRSLVPARAGFLPNGFEAVNAGLRQMIDLAYGGDPTARVAEIIGGPPWLDEARFDISARGQLEGPDAQRQGRLMLRTLFEERFKLRVRREARERPIYSLVILRGDRRTGPALKPAPLDCHTRTETRPPGTSGLMYCGIDRLPGRSMGRSMPMALLADTLSSLVGRHVADRTGLAGEYDWDLAWAPFPGEPAPLDPDITPTPPADGPSILAAVQEQLGLRLEVDTAVLEVLVIESVDRPSSN